MWSSKRAMRTACAAVLVVAVGLGAAALDGAFGPPALTPAQRAAQVAAARARAAAAAQRRALAAQHRDVDSAAALVGVTLPTAAGAAAPPTTTAIFSTPLPAHVVLGFVPYWEVPTLDAADYADTSELAYYGVDVGATGGLDHSGNGWDDLQGTTFTTFVTNAHNAGDRVLFTVSTTNPTVVSHLTRDPKSAGAQLATQAGAVIVADHLDGIDVDIEGRASSERAGFVSFVADLVADLHRIDPRSEVVLDTYPQSASSGDDFFDVSRLAPYVDTFFVMAYDMIDPSFASANSPLSSPTLGLSDLEALQSYQDVAPKSKIVLGLPLYGYDFETVGRVPGSATLSTDPLAVTYSSIVATGRKVLWDPGTETAYYEFRRDGEWHQTWFDDPLSFALKTALAVSFGDEGVGAWALGQEGAANDMLAALDGGTAPRKLGLTPPP